VKVLCERRMTELYHIRGQVTRSWASADDPSRRLVSTPATSGEYMSCSTGKFFIRFAQLRKNVILIAYSDRLVSASRWSYT
jgi:hypothetical protein